MYFKELESIVICEETDSCLHYLIIPEFPWTARGNKINMKNTSSSNRKECEIEKIVTMNFSFLAEDYDFHIFVFQVMSRVFYLYIFENLNC